MNVPPGTALSSSDKLKDGFLFSFNSKYVKIFFETVFDKGELSRLMINLSGH